MGDDFRDDYRDGHADGYDDVLLVTCGVTMKHGHSDILLELLGQLLGVAGSCRLL